MVSQIYYRLDFPYRRTPHINGTLHTLIGTLGIVATTPRILTRTLCIPTGTHIFLTRTLRSVTGTVVFPISTRRIAIRTGRSVSRTLRRLTRTPVFVFR